MTPDPPTNVELYLTVSPAFPARYGGKPCGKCRRPIERGDQARFVSNEARGIRSLCHDRCVDPELIKAQEAGTANPSIDDVMKPPTAEEIAKLAKDRRR